jgi:hypothetical protein
MPAGNGRFCEMAAVTPQTGQYLIASYYPAASSVKAATSQSRWTLSVILGQRSAFWRQKTKTNN